MATMYMITIRPFESTRVAVFHSHTIYASVPQSAEKFKFTIFRIGENISLHVFSPKLHKFSIKLAYVKGRLEGTYKTYFYSDILR